MSRWLAAFAMAVFSPLAVSAPAQAQADAPAPSQLMQDIEAYLKGPGLNRRRYSADNGDPRAMVDVSDALEKKFGGRAGGSAAILPIQLRYLMGAIEKAHGPAFHRLGEIVRLGRTPEGGPMEALGFFEQGAKLGDRDSVLAYFKMARDIRVCSDCTRGRIKDSLELTRAYTPAEQKIIDGSTIFSSENLKARGAAEDRAIFKYTAEKKAMVQQALTFLASEPVKDDWLVQSALANAHIYGVKGIKYPRLRLGFFEPSDEPQFLLPEPEKAVPILNRFAQKGERDALDFLSKLHLTGQFKGFPKDRELFIKYTSQLGATGHIEGAYRLGNIMVTGKPFGTDFDMAAKYLYQAHEAGSAKATLDLGMMFFSGRGVEKDEATALRLLEEAGSRGSSKAADILAEYWEKGLGGTRNPMRASIWTKKAAENREKEKKGAELMANLNQLGQ
ncbi:hypothetical protein IP79_03195 [Porphyrobacter sp. AAP60]|nr:hypothetical protein IP79_03195 [Porphyrobacter sp. AAP60]